MHVRTVKLLILLCLCTPAAAQFYGGPILPQSVPNVTYPSESSYTITPVASGANLQTVITAAGCGTVLDLETNGSWSSASSYTFPNTSCACHTDPTKWTIIRSHAYANGSVRGTRLDPSTEYANLAHITSTNGSSVFNGTSAQVSCYWFVGLDVYGTGSFATIQFGGTQLLSIANFTHDIVIDHCYVHGLPTTSLGRTIVWGGNWESVVDSYISDAHASGADAQAILFGDGSGPFLIQNNFLEGSTENTMSGGAPKNAFSSDFTFAGNHHFKPMAWSKYDSTYTGVPWVFKNNIEFKDGQRILVTGSVFENMWADGQHEGEILNTNCSGSAPGINYVSDVTEYYNIFKGTSSQWFVFGGCGTATAQPDLRVFLHDNLAYNMDPCEPSGCGGAASIQFNSGLPSSPPLPPFAAFDLWVIHNTFSGNNYQFGVQFSDQSAYYGFQFRNNIFGSGTPPAFANPSRIQWIDGQSVVDGNPTHAQNFPTGKANNNCFYGPGGGTYTDSTFNGMQTPANAAAVFVNPGVDFHVSASSVCHNASDDAPARDMGANIDAVNAATANTVKALGTSVAVTNVSPSTFTHTGGTSLTITGSGFLNESGLAVIIGGAGPASTISTTSCSVNTCTVVMSTPISLQVNDTIAVAGMSPENGNAGIQSSDAVPFTVASVTDTTHFTYTNHAVGTVSSTGGTVHRFTPGNACTSVVVSGGGTTITCNTPAASGAVTTGPINTCVSQWGIPVCLEIASYN